MNIQKIVIACSLLLFSINAAYGMEATLTPAEQEAQMLAVLRAATEAATKEAEEVEEELMLCGECTTLEDAAAAFHQECLQVHMQQFENQS